MVLEESIQRSVFNKLIFECIVTTQRVAATTLLLLVMFNSVSPSKYHQWE